MTAPDRNLPLRTHPIGNTATLDLWARYYFLQVWKNLYRETREDTLVRLLKRLWFDPNYCHQSWLVSSRRINSDTFSTSTILIIIYLIFVQPLASQQGHGAGSCSNDVAFGKPHIAPTWGSDAWLQVLVGIAINPAYAWRVAFSAEAICVVSFFILLHALDGTILSFTVSFVKSCFLSLYCVIRMEHPHRGSHSEHNWSFQSSI